jgi:hypothetical protein
VNLFDFNEILIIFKNTFTNFFYMPFWVDIRFSPKNDSAVLNRTIDQKWEWSYIQSINGYAIQELDPDTVDALFGLVNAIQWRVSITLINGEKLEYPFIAKLDETWWKTGTTFTPSNDIKLWFDGEKFIAKTKRVSRNQLDEAFFHN